jgi:thiosulfate dehydrogenase [quinone] large subunit
VVAEYVEIREPRFAKFWFASTHPLPALLWLAARLYLGYQWVHAGWEKITGTESGWHWVLTDDSWLKSSAGLKGFVGFALSQTEGPHAAVNYGWYAAMLRWVEGQAGWIAPVIAITETVIGVALIAGAFVGIASFIGLTLNTSFVLAGVAGVNPVFMIIEGLLILAWRNAGWYGADRFLLRWLGVPGEPGTIFTRRKEGESGEPPPTTPQPPPTTPQPDPVS